MRLETIRVPKAAGSYADVLVAVGVADLVAELARPDAGVVLRDDGGTYVVDVSAPLDTDQLRHRGHVGPGYPYIQFKDDDSRAPPDAFHYSEQRAIEAQARSATQAARSAKAKRVALEQGVADEIAVDPELSVVKIYNSMRTGSDTYNQLHVALRETPTLPRIVAERLEQLASPSSIATRATGEEVVLAKTVSNLQFWNPTAGKGVARVKPDGTALGSLPDRLVDWFAEWMKFRGMRHTLVAYRVGDDYKVFVLAPGDVPLSLLHEVRRELLKQALWGSIRLDIEAALVLAQILVERSPARQESLATHPVYGFLSSEPNRVIRGLATAYFKSLGSATAAMNVSFLGLPGWFPADTPQRVNDWLQILSEYRARLRNFREDNSDHIGPLLSFRDFVSGGRLEDGLEFFGQCAVLLLQQGERLSPFRADNLRRVVMSYESERPGLTEIIEDEGFKSLAQAIRACTINAQYHKRQLARRVWNDPLRVEVRYGLAQDWRRVVDRRSEFVQKLADFVASYNAEAARRLEKGDPAELLITEEDLARVIRLIDRTGEPGLVGRLLIAFGYASDWRRPGDGPASGNGAHANLTSGGEA
jgi:hypothetical protein